MILQKFPKNCMRLRKIWTVGGRPLRSGTGHLFRVVNLLGEQWRIQDFPDGGRAPTAGFWVKTENCIENKLTLIYTKE